MFHSFYVSTVDRKGRAHNYRLLVGEGVPAGHEITNLRVAGYDRLADVLPEEVQAALMKAFPSKGRKTSKRRNAKA